MTFTAETDVVAEQVVPSLAKNVAKISRLSSIYLVGSILPQAVAMCLLPIFTYYLRPEQLGIVYLSTRLITPITIFVALGLAAGLRMQYFHVDPLLRPVMIRTVLVGLALQSIVICALLSLAGVWIAGAFLPNLPLDEKHVYYLWLMIVWSCCFSSISDMATAAAQLLERAGTSVAITLFGYFSQASLGVAYVVLLGWNGFGRQGTFFMAYVLTAILSFGIAWGFGKGVFNFAMFRHVSMMGLGFIPHFLCNSLQFALNGWLLNKLVSSSALAIFSIAFMFACVLEMPMNAITYAVYPTLAQLMNDKGPESRRQQGRLYTLMSIIVVGLVLGIQLFAPIAILILTAPDYHEATQLVPVIVLAWLFEGFYLLVSQPVFYFAGGVGLSLASGSAVVATLILSLILIPVLGIAGAAWALVGCFAVKFAVAALISRRVYRIPWELGRVYKTVALGVAVALVDLWLSPQLSLSFALVLKVGLGISFVLALLAVGVATTDELRRILHGVLGRQSNAG